MPSMHSLNAAIRALSSPVYTERVKVPKWTSTVSPLMDADVGGRLLRFRLPDWTKTDHISAASKLVAAARKAEKAWNRILDREHFRVFGKQRMFHDYKISGIGRDEYSPQVKNVARKLAQFISSARSAAFAHYRAAGKRGRPVW